MPTTTITAQDLRTEADSLWNNYATVATAIVEEHVFAQPLTFIDTVSSLQPGDIAFMFDEDNNDRYRLRRLREAVLNGTVDRNIGFPSGGVYRIDGVTAKSIMATMVPRSSNAYGVGPIDFKKTHEGTGYTASYRYRDSGHRTWVRIGNYEQVMNAMLADERVAEAEFLLAAYEAKWAEYGQVVAAENAVQDAARISAQAEIDRVNDLCGAKVFTRTWDNQFQTNVPSEVVKALYAARFAAGMIDEAGRAAIADALAAARSASR